MPKNFIKRQSRFEMKSYKKINTLYKWFVSIPCNGRFKNEDVNKDKQVEQK